MTEGGGGKGPEIIIASKGASIEELRQRAEETKARPHGMRSEEEVPKSHPSEEPRPEEPKEPKKKGRLESFFEKFGPAAEALLIEESLETIRELARNARGKRGFGKGEGAGGGGTGEGGKETAEKDEGRSFAEIQEDLIKLIDNPDKEKEDQLRVERARLINAAKEAGVFESIKGVMANIQEHSSFDEAFKKIAALNTEQRELEAKGLRHWDEKFEGMIDEYRNVGLLHMRLAVLRAEGKDDSQEAQRLQTQIRYRGWGVPPSSLEVMAMDYLERGREVPRSEAREVGGEAVGPLTAAADAMERVAKSQERMARGEYFIDVTRFKEVDTQRSFVRELLGGIEKSNRDTHDIANSYLVRGLEAALDDMFPEVAREVKARLALHDCSDLIKQCNGWIFRESDKVGPGYQIGSAAAEVDRRGHSLTREIVQVFLAYTDKEGKPFLPGLDVPAAWNELQNLNHFETVIVNGGEQKIYRYRELVRELRSKDLLVGVPNEPPDENLENYYREENPIRKEAVRKYIIAELAKKTGGNNDEEKLTNAEKSFQLAEKLAKATLEESVFARGDPPGNDEAAEIFGLKDYRAVRRGKGRVRGPQVHEEEIDGFGTSWLRRSRRKYTVKEYYPDKEDYKDLTDEEKKEFNAFILKKSLEDRVTSPLKAEDVDISRIRNDYLYYCAVVVSRYKLLSQLILDRKPKIAEMDKTFMQTAVVYFNTADNPGPFDPRTNTQKLGPMRLRALWVVGVVDMALADRELDTGRMSIGMALGQFIKAATREVLSPESGTFISPRTWEGLRQKINFDARLRELGAEKGFRAFMAKALNV